MIEQRLKLKKLLEEMEPLIEELRGRIDTEHIPGLTAATKLCDLADQVEDLVSDMWHDDALDYVKNLPPVERKTEEHES